MLAVGILAKEPGAKIIYNLICSKAVPEVVREHGGEPIRTRVGHSFIKQVMAETGAAFGGEHSAHYYFRDNYRADSGIIATMFVLEQMSQIGDAAVRAAQAARAVRGLRRDQHARRRRARRRSSVSPRTTQDAKQDRLDGLTVDLGDWWFNLRPSNTEPLLRLNLEARRRATTCDTHVAEVLALITDG